MDALLLVGDIKAGVVGTSRAARIGEDEDALGPVHEGCCIGLGRAHGACFELLLAASSRYDPLRSAGHLGDVVMAEAFEKSIERGLDRRKSADVLDQVSPGSLGLRVCHRIAMLVTHGARMLLAGVVGIDLHLAGRKCAGEIVEAVFERGQLDIKLGAFLGRELAQPAVEDRFSRRHQLQHHRFAFAQVLLDRADDGRQLHRQEHLAEEPLLAGFEPGPRCGLCPGVERLAL